MFDQTLYLTFSCFVFASEAPKALVAKFTRTIASKKTLAPSIVTASGTFWKLLSSSCEYLSHSLRHFTMNGLEYDLTNRFETPLFTYSCWPAACHLSCYDVASVGTGSNGGRKLDLQNVANLIELVENTRNLFPNCNFSKNGSTPKTFGTPTKRKRSFENRQKCCWIKNTTHCISWRPTKKNFIQ